MNTLIRVNISIAGLLNFVASLTQGQYNQTIRADRPGQSISVFTVGAGILQVQSGFDNFGSNDHLNGIKTNGFLNNTVVRYGLAEKLEVNYQFQYQIQSVTQNDNSTEQRGVNAMDLGIRYHIYTGKGLVPSVAFQFSDRLPLLGKAFEIKGLAPRFSLVTTQHLTEETTLTTVSGASWSGSNSSAEGHYVVNISFPLLPGLGGFVENYGTLASGALSAYFDGGFAWLLNNDLQLGLYGGYANNLGVSSYFMSTGISWRTKQRQATTTKE